MTETALGSSMSQLCVNNLRLSFGGLLALNHVSLRVEKGEFISIIGPNGAGKTTLLNCITGFYRAGEGNIQYEGRQISHFSPYEISRLGIGRTFQNLELFRGMTVLENLLLARHIHLRYGLLSALTFFGKARAQEVVHRRFVEEIIDFLEMQSISKKIVHSLPFGLQKRVELGRALALEPSLLLLDEPMAGMNVEEKEEMVRFIVESNEVKGITTILVEHDLQVVMDISKRVSVLDFGVKIAEGTPLEVRKNPEVIKAYLGETASS
jgi:branched-chain amino acid transport system ATP-binding protein